MKHFFNSYGKSVVLVIGFVFLAVSFMTLYNGYYDYKSKVNELEQKIALSKETDVNQMNNNDNENVVTDSESDTMQNLENIYAKATDATNQVLSFRNEIETIVNSDLPYEEWDHARLDELYDGMGSFMTNKHLCGKWYVSDSEYPSTWRAVVCLDTSLSLVPVFWICEDNNDGSILACVSAVYNVSTNMFESDVLYITTVGAYRYPVERGDPEDADDNSQSTEEFMSNLEEMLTGEDGSSWLDPPEGYEDYVSDPEKYPPRWNP